MKEKQVLEPIKDSEFNMFLEYDYASKLEFEILGTEMGKKVRMLEKLGFGISVSKIVEEYISKEGYTLDNVGNLLVDEKTLEEIYKEEEYRISQDLGIDISKIDDISVLQRIILDPRYKSVVEKHGIDIAVALHNTIGNNREDMKKIYGFKDFIFLLDEFSDKKFNNEEFKSIAEIFYDHIPTYIIRESLMDDAIFNFSEEKTEEIVKKLEEQTINSSLNNKISTRGMRTLYKLREVSSNDEYDNEIARENEIQSCINELEKILPDFQYKDFIVDEDGKINIDKAIVFLNDWEKIRNETKLTEDLNSMANSVFSKIDSKNLPKFLIAIRKATRGQNLENKEMAIKIAEKLRDVSGFDLFKDGELDIQKIGQIYSEIFDGRDIDEAIDQLEWNVNTAEGKLDRIDTAIDNDLGIRRDSRDQINLSKDLATEILERQKEDKQNAVEAILLQERCSPEQIVALFYEFRYKELEQNKKKFEKFRTESIKRFYGTWYC